MTKLKITGIYKDGGSYSLVDEKGNKYWQDNAFRSKEGKVSKGPGTIYHGDINAKNPKKAEGVFEIELIKKRSEKINRVSQTKGKFKSATFDKMVKVTKLVEDDSWKKDLYPRGLAWTGD